MKRIVALLVCLVMLCPSMIACQKRSETDMGPIFNAYIGCEPYVLDPQINHTDDDAVQLMSLIFEGLTKINSKGKVENALLKSYTYTKDETKGEYTLTLTLNETSWSDARRVSADDFLFSWKRILSPDFSSNAASLLYDVKNAKAAKSGDASVDDIGIAAVDTYRLEVKFDHDIDVNQFLRNCASIALVPLRDDVVGKSERSWSKKSTNMVANGPFALKGLDYEKGSMRLERNAYYFLGEDDDLLKYVIPYRIFITFSKDDSTKPQGSSKSPESLSAQLSAFLENNIKVLTDMPLSERANYSSKGTLKDSASTLSAVINTKHASLSDNRVRQALSYAVDRNEIVSRITYAKAADGLINHTCFDGNTNKSFRTEGGSLISTSADMAKAQSLLSEAKVLSGSFKLTYRQTEEDAAVAEYLKAQWETLGFTVTLEPVLAVAYDEKDKATEQYNTFYDDTLNTKYANGDYDVILVDYMMISADPFAALASFAKEFSGNACDIKNNWAIVGNMCGFDDETYNSTIASAYAEKDTNKRAAILHQAETYLMEQMPIIPLAFNQYFYLAAGDISGEAFGFNGYVDFRKVNLKNYLDYYTEEA